MKNNLLLSKSDFVDTEALRNRKRKINNNIPSKTMVTFRPNP